MKKLLTVLLILVVVCTSVFAFDVSLGAFGAYTKYKLKMGALLSVGYEPVKYNDYDLGLKADYIYGVYDEYVGEELGDPNQPTSVGAVKVTASKYINDIKVLAGVGIGFNGFTSSSTKAVVAELSATKNFYEYFSFGASLDCAFGVYSNGEPFKESIIPAGKLFLSYSF